MVAKKKPKLGSWQEWLQDGRAAILCWVSSMVVYSFHTVDTTLRNAVVLLTGIVITNLGAYQIKSKSEPKKSERAEKDDMG